MGSTGLSFYVVKKRSEKLEMVAGVIIKESPNRKIMAKQDRTDQSNEPGDHSSHIDKSIQLPVIDVSLTQPQNNLIYYRYGNGQS